MLQQLAAQALAAGIFKKLFGEGEGGTSNASGIVGALGNIFGGRQFGGGVQAGQPVTAAEGGRFGAEVFVPNQGGQVVPLGTDRGAGGMGAAPQVNVTTVNALDQSEIVGSFQEGAGDQVLLNRISVKRSSFRRALGL